MFDVFLVVFVSFLCRFCRFGGRPMERVRRIMRIHVLIVLAMDHDIVKGGPWSEGVFDVFVSFLGRF